MESKNYKVVNTHKPYVDGEYPSGGYEIFLIVDGRNLPVSTAPDMDSVMNFIKLISKNKTIQVEFSHGT